MAICGTAGSGKTFSALAIASNLVPGGRVALIDTERGSASLYADQFAFDTLNLETHSPDAYVEAIHDAEAAGYDVLVIDSLSHAWSGRDGALEQVDKTSAREGRGNNFTAWRTITPKHNRFVDAIVSCKSHVVATLRTKTEWVLDRDEKTGKTSPRRVGMEPIQRQGLEYEFGVVGDIDLDHKLVITKTRCSALADAVIEKPGKQLADVLRAWLSDGSAPAAQNSELATYLAGIAMATNAMELERAATAPGAPAKDSPDRDRAIAAYRARKAELSA